MHINISYRALRLHCSSCSLLKWKNMTSSDFEPFAHLILRCSMLLGVIKEIQREHWQQWSAVWTVWYLPPIYDIYMVILWYIMVILGLVWDTGMVWDGILLALHMCLPCVYPIAAKARKASVAQCAKRQVGPGPEHRASGEAPRIPGSFPFTSFHYTGPGFYCSEWKTKTHTKGKPKLILCSWVTRHSSRPNCKSYKRQLCGVASPLWVVLRSTAPDINTWLSFNLAAICFEVDENRGKEATCLKAE